jgi:hypothetical protein
LTWKLKGTKFSRLLFQLQPKTHRTEEIDVGLLPTPTAMMDEAPIEKVDARNQKQMEKGNSPFILGLGQQAMRGMLPTPTAMDSTNATATMNSTQVKEGSMHSVTLARAMTMGMLPTPTLQDYTNSTFPPSQMKRGHVVGHLMREGISPGSQLNPRFVAEMMGFPPNWTELPFQSGEQNQSKDTATQ